MLRTLRSPRWLLLLLTVSACAASGEEKTITVDDPRPVAAAVKKIEQLYVTPITYEDPPYIHESEIKDAELESRGPQSGHRIIPKGGPLSFTYEVPPENAAADTRKALAAVAVVNMVRNYNAARHTEMFTVIEGNGVLHVIPQKFTNAAGVPEQLTPILSTPVSVPSGIGRGDQILTAITSLLSSKAGKPIWVAAWPGRVLNFHLTKITSSNEPARSVLDRLLNEIPVGYDSKPNKFGGTHLIAGGGLSWQLFCDPDPQFGCALNLYFVLPEGRTGGGIEGLPPEMIRPEDHP